MLGKNLGLGPKISRDLFRSTASLGLPQQPFKYLLHLEIDSALACNVTFIDFAFIQRHEACISFWTDNRPGPALFFSVSCTKTRASPRNVTVTSSTSAAYHILILVYHSQLFVNFSVLLSVNWGRSIITYIYHPVNSTHRCKTWDKSLKSLKFS